MKQHLRSGRLDHALAGIAAFVDKLQADPQTAGQPVGSRRADRLCLAAGRRILDETRPVRGEKREPRDVYIATEIYPGGGHTAVIGDFVNAAPERSAWLLLTDYANAIPEPDPAAVCRTRIPLQNTAVAPPGSAAGKLRWLVRKLQQLKPQRLFLFHHPHDTVAVAAGQPQLAEQVYVVHHVDGAPCLGVDCPEFVHVDVTPFRLAVCGRRLAPRRPLFLPLCVEDPGPTVRPQNAGPLRTATSGREVKFARTGPGGYPAIIAGLIEATGVRHLHIGPLSSEFQRAIRDAFSDPSRFRSHFQHVEHVPSLRRALQDQRVDLYLNSFPQRGARASVEVLSAGTPAIWHAEQTSWFRDTHMKYPQAAVWREPSELIRLVQSATPAWLADQAHAARRWYETHHHPSILARCLGGAQVSGWQPPRPAAMPLR